MRYFDANCHLGRFNHWSGREPVTPTDLIQTMDHYGIHEALVVSSMARENHPLDGNKAIIQDTADHPRLHAAWAALPPRSRELPPPSELVDEMAESGVEALFLYPGQYQFSLDEWCIDSLLGPLAERRVPLFISPDGLIGSGYPSDTTDWHNVVRICRAFPDLPVVVSETRIKRTAWTVYQALDACSNLYLDMSSLWLHHSIEFIVREWGAERLLFGTGLPTRDPGATLAQLNYADISDEDVAAIASENLHRLLSWNQDKSMPTPDVRFSDPIDELHALARERAPMRGQKILCCHGHLGNHHYVHVPDGSTTDLVEELDRVGLEKAIIFANAGMNGDETYGNDLVADAVRQYPDRFIGFTFVNLNRTPEAMWEEMERGWASGLRGVKLHPYLQEYDTYGPAVEVACQFAHDRHTFIVNHYWGDAERLRYLCRKYPDACFMTGHTSQEALPVVHEVDNLYIGSCPLLTYGITEEFVDKGGAEHILFGSDLSWLPVSWGYGPVLYARIPLTAKRQILGDNLRRLLQEYNPEKT